MFKYELFVLFCYMGVQDGSCVVHRDMFDSLNRCNTEFHSLQLKAKLFGEKMLPVSGACIKRNVEKMLRDWS